MTDESKMTLSANMVKHLQALAGLAGKVQNASAAIRADLSNLTEEQVDRYNTAARQYYRDTIKDEKRRALALGLLAKVIALYRTEKGWKSKRGKGAGRKAKGAKDAATAEASVLDQYTAAVNYCMVHWYDVTDDQRKTALVHLMQRLDQWKAAGFRSKADSK